MRSTRVTVTAYYLLHRDSAAAAPVNDTVLVASSKASRLARAASGSNLTLVMSKEPAAMLDRVHAFALSVSSSI